MNREEQAKQNRERMPMVTAIVEDFKGVFGPVRVIYAQENGIEVGTPRGTTLLPSIPLTQATGKITFANALRQKKRW